MCKVAVLLLASLLVFAKSESYGGVFALTWLAGFCQYETQNHREGCSASIPQLWDNQSHTIHGLWPDQESSQTYGAFNISIFQKEPKLLDDMYNYWPPKSKASTTSTFLWEHEWQKHGKDYAHIVFKLRPEDFPGTTAQRNTALQLTYFRDAINLYKRLKVTKFPGADFSKEEYAQHIGVNASNLILSCFKASWIRETQVCFDITKSGIVLKKCTKSSATCSKEGAFLSLYEWNHKSQSRVFDYPKALPMLTAE